MGRLFSTDQVKTYAAPQVEEATVLDAGVLRNAMVLGKVSDTLDKLFPALEPDHAYHYASAGQWSTHDMLFHFLAMTGPADVHIATWSMTEDPVRMLIAGIDAGVIRALSGILDIRVKIRNPGIFAFAKQNMAQVRLSVCHAKVTVIENDDWAVSIVGSANYTNNPRIEAGVVTVNRPVAAFHREWIRAEMENAHPFES